MERLYKYNIFKIGDYSLNVLAVFEFFFLILFVLLFLFILKKSINKAIKQNIARKYAIYNLIKYLILVVTFVFALQILGFNLSVLIAGSAALLVGIGLGLQNLFSDFVSGIILLVDSTVKVNDVIEVNGLVCKVQQIKLRTTTVLTRDEKYIILPNTDLTRNQLINWTHSAVSSRFDIPVGVDYSTDVISVMKILKEAVDMQDGVLKEPAPFVRITDFAESSLNFSVYFWSEEVFRVENIKSEIRVRIFELFKSNSIKIPFPQRVIHINK